MPGSPGSRRRLVGIVVRLLEPAFLGDEHRIGHGHASDERLQLQPHVVRRPADGDRHLAAAESGAPLAPAALLLRRRLALLVEVEPRAADRPAGVDDLVAVVGIGER